MGTVRVNVWDSTGSKRLIANIPDDAEVSRILPALISRMNLPLTNVSGQPMSYKLQHKNSGRQLSEYETLRNAAVTDGDTLRIQPEIIAGTALPFDRCTGCTFLPAGSGRALPLHLFG